MSVPSSEPAVAVSLISCDPNLHETVAEALGQNPLQVSLSAIKSYPSPTELECFEELEEGPIVLLDISDPRRAKMTAAEIDNNHPNAITIALSGDNLTARDLQDLMQFGIRQVVEIPISAPDLNQAVTRAARKLHSRSAHDNASSRVYAFLPAKPGVGATTLATHTAVAISRLDERKTLLVDFDLKLGMTTFLLKLQSGNSVVDALTALPELDLAVWDRLVSRRDSLDILASAPAEIDRHIAPGSGSHLLECAKQYYETICVDLPSDISEWEMETLSMAKEIFLVCSPDLGTLHLAKRRSEQLRMLGLNGTLSVIMNRADSGGAFSISDVERILGLPVSFSVPSDYGRIVEATRQGIALEGDAPIVSKIESIAQHINPYTNTVQPKPRTFSQFFSISPIRERLARRQG